MKDKELRAKVERQQHTIDRLSRQVAELVADSNIRLGSFPFPPPGWTWYSRYPKVSVRSAVETIIEHLGLEIERVPKRNASVKLVEKEPEDV